MTTVQELFKVGLEILHVARVILADRGVGVTIIVHEAKLSATYRPAAVVTTLPSRRHQRAVMADALVGMAIIDGATPEQAGELANRDVAALDAGELDSSRDGK